VCPNFIAYEYSDRHYACENAVEFIWLFNSVWYMLTSGLIVVTKLFIGFFYFKDHEKLYLLYCVNIFCQAQYVHCQAPTIWYMTLCKFPIKWRYVFVMLLWVCRHRASWKVCLTTVRGSRSRDLWFAIVYLRGQVGSSGWYFGAQFNSFDISVFLRSWIFCFWCYTLRWVLKKGLESPGKVLEFHLHQRVALFNGMVTFLHVKREVAVFLHVNRDLNPLSPSQNAETINFTCIFTDLE
jgi:hypothetical protein